MYSSAISLVLLEEKTTGTPLSNPTTAAAAAANQAKTFHKDISNTKEGLSF